LPLAGIAHAAPEPQPKPELAQSTPELLDRAVASREIDRDTADLYLAYALSEEWERVPERFVGQAPWRGTLHLLRLRQELAGGTAGRHRREISAVLSPDRAGAAAQCGDDVGGPNRQQSDHFVIDYGDIFGGLNIDDYKASLDTAWDTEVDAFGWAAPPTDPAAPGDKYHVVIAALGSGLYGYVTTEGDFAGFQGNNPSTAWNDQDAYISCMVLNRNYGQAAFPGTSQQALDATTGHEFNHSIQFGYGTLTGIDSSGLVADQVFVEGGATWMEDEAFDGANDNHNYLWPDFTEDMGTYQEGPSDFPYPYWVVFRAMTEPFGTGIAGGGEDVFQRYWEKISQNTSEDLVAVNSALVAEGTTLANAYHDAAIALRFNRDCSGDYDYPYCLEEGPDYVAAAGAPSFQGTIASVGNRFMGSVRDNYALNWVKLPATGTYDVTLQNTSGGGQLRASVACNTGSAISVDPFPAVAAGGQTQTLEDFNADDCTNGTEFAVITNQNQTAADPGSSAARSYTLSTEAPGPKVSIADVSANEGDVMTFNLSLSEPVATDVTVDYFTDDYSAIAPGDYTPDSTSVTFAALDMDQTIEVPTIQDASAEGDETFFVRLDGVTTGNATIGDGRAVGTIVDDEVPTCPGYEGDPRNQVVGTAAANTLNGTGGADIICGLGGKDTVNGLAGNDLLLGGPGTDTLLGGDGADRLDGGTGNDGANRSTFDDWGSVGLFGGAGNDVLIGDDGTDDLFGGNGNDRLEGGAAYDILFGETGVDALLGGAGNDELQGNRGNDSLNGGTGYDLAAFLNEAGPVKANLSTGKASGTGLGTDTLVAVEDLWGTRKADTLTGNGASNFLFGDNGNDRLLGGAANDALYGLKGNDTFNGGLGTDRCVQGSGSGVRTACEVFSKVQRSTGRAPAPHSTMR
jgi:Ca2+-binding RTX toxin-like protein